MPQGESSRGRFNLVGQKFKEFTVLADIGHTYVSGRTSRIKWLCVCSCGTFCLKTSAALKNPTVQSCGHLWKEHTSTFNKDGKYREAQKKSVFAKYGTEYAMQSRDIALRSGQRSTKDHKRVHWKTGEIVPCRGSYEAIAVDYFNKYQIDFDFQIPFRMPNGSVYFVDFLDKERNMYIEVKGWFRDNESRYKYETFAANYPCELWQKSKIEELKKLLS